MNAIGEASALPIAITPRGRADRSQPVEGLLVGLSLSVLLWAGIGGMFLIF